MWVNHNGQLSKKPSVSIKNRSFRYGDGLFESVRLFQGKVFNRAAHEERLSKGIKTLHLSLPISLSELFDQIESLALKNALVNGAKGRLVVYRAASGLYSPTSNEAAFLIEVDREAAPTFELQAIDSIGIYREHLKPANALSTIKSNNALLYVLAGIHKREQSWDDILLLNEKGHLVEANSSNLFVRVGDKCFTPPLTEGCLDGTMRALLLSLFDFKEQVITLDDLAQSDEIFLTNSGGVSAVTSWEGKVMQESISHEVVKQLNKLISS
jgi:branched-chain amino acid aminotransferase